MDFLDPKAKRRHIIRLIIGYGLMAVLIVIATIILVFSAYGFDVDRKTGEVIQNGLVFVDSAPDDAAIRFNDQEQKERTNNRFALPAGQYDLRISKNGYREWRRHFALNGGAVERFTYPLLIPAELNRRPVQTYAAAPAFSTQSPDRRWAIMTQADSLTNFIEYDLNSLTKELPKERAFSVPAGLLTAAGGAHTIELVEWSNDNKHFLIKHGFAGGNEFVVISRDQPETSININKLLARNPSSVVFKDKKFDHWYLHTLPAGIVETADAKKTITPVLSDVTVFKTHGDDTLLYSQLANNSQTQRVSLRQGSDAYVIRDFPNAPIHLDIARYDSAWYMVIGSDGEQKTFIYKDPVAVLQRKDGTKPTPLTILKSAGALTKVSFSKNTRFITAQSGLHFETFDAEYARLYKFDQKTSFDEGTKVEWMDGHRLLARAGGKAFIFDYDGENQQELVGSHAGAPVMFDRDYTVLYRIEAAPAAAGQFGFYATDLRLEGDK